jgi:hypothetical protein
VTRNPEAAARSSKALAANTHTLGHDSCSSLVLDIRFRKRVWKGALWEVNPCDSVSIPVAVQVPVSFGLCDHL